MFKKRDRDKEFQRLLDSCQCNELRWGYVGPGEFLWVYRAEDGTYHRGVAESEEGVYPQAREVGFNRDLIQSLREEIKRLEAARATEPRFKLGEEISLAWSTEDERGVYTFNIGAIVQTDAGYFYLSDPLRFDAEDGPHIDSAFDWTYWCPDKAARATREEADAELRLMAVE